MTTKTNNVPKEVQTKLDNLTTVSAKIRYLDSQGWTRGQIAKHLDKRYQHVRNVLITPIKTPKES